jgi:DNA mismatch endonuclease (patch repair protein)
MTDTLTPAQRGWLMSRIRSADTQPELIVRSLLHRLGFRFSLRRTDLPGKPDIVLRRWHCVVFVHGCFWHRHAVCAVVREPKSRTDFWNAKLERNVARDAAVQAALAARGWRVVVVWECELKDRLALAERLQAAIRGEAPAEGFRLARVAEDSVAYGRTLARKRRGRVPALP